MKGDLTFHQVIVLCEAQRVQSEPFILPARILSFWEAKKVKDRRREGMRAEQKGERTQRKKGRSDS